MTGCPEESIGEWLLKCAVERGASHYQRGFPDDLPPDQPNLTDEEIGIALCLGEHTYNSAFIRAAAQLLSSPRTDCTRLARLAVMERVEPVLLYIAQVASRFAPEAQPWGYLRAHLPEKKISSSKCPATLVAFCEPNRSHSLWWWAGNPMALPPRIPKMSNPLRILKTLDKYLTSPAEITLFGRAALALGYVQAPAHFHNTQDVDGILPMAWLQPSDAHEDFWQAVQQTNAELEPAGLYLTHLFREIDVILQPDWMLRRVR